MTALPALREDDIVAAIAAIVGSPSHGRVRLGIGDDAALWQPSRSHRSAITTDALIEDVHFSRATMSLSEAGRRAIAASSSDLAAMGARPVLATVALGVPAGAALEETLELFRGMATQARLDGLAIVGGDLTRSPLWMLSITAVGEVRPSNVKTRSGARPGDILAVTGPLGASRAGLEVAQRSLPLDATLAAEALQAHRTPAPRLREGRFLAASQHVTAMMDCSDGLSTDLARLCAAGDCGALLERVPVAACAVAVASALGTDAEHFALSGGEDYELLVAIRPRAFEHLASRFVARFGRPLEYLGIVSRERAINWSRNGRIEPMQRSGWDHFAS
jgi:thiamine-monophosphate kinase